MPGIVFDIQNYAIHDGPGIRTCVFLKGCPLSCSWCHNPESQSVRPEMAYWAGRCASCGACVENCPYGALEMKNGKVERDHETCAACGKCAELCPNQAMEKIGKERSAAEIADMVVRDRPFFDESGGGVTVTGGEPTLQDEFLFELLEELKSRGLHTAIETCGFFPRELLDRLIEQVDLFLYDVKHVDQEEHKRATGADNRLITDNFIEIVKRAGPDRVVPRVPLIPGFNVDMTSISDIIRFLGKSGYVSGPVHLMPCHSWAKDKYERLGRAGSFHDPGEVSKGEIARITRAFVQAGLEPVLHG